MALEQELTNRLTQAIKDKDARTADVVRMLKTRLQERRTAKGFSGQIDDALEHHAVVPVEAPVLACSAGPVLDDEAPRLDGAFIFDKQPRGITALMPRLHRTAMTIGFVIVSAAPLEGTLSVHERHHIK